MNSIAISIGSSEASTIFPIHSVELLLMDKRHIFLIGIQKSACFGYLSIYLLTLFTLSCRSKCRDPDLIYLDLHDSRGHALVN